jgi:hypothetical protein
MIAFVEVASEGFLFDRAREQPVGAAAGLRVGSVRQPAERLVPLTVAYLGRERVETVPGDSRIGVARQTLERGQAALVGEQLGEPGCEPSAACVR